MPELPEVQTTVNGLQKIINKKIYNIEVYTIKLRYIVPKKITYLVKNKKIIRIFRIAKYIIFQLSNDISLVFHLGMSGRIKLFKFINYKTTKHDHIKLNISNHNIVVFNDPRKFGFVDFSGFICTCTSFIVELSCILDDSKYFNRLVVLHSNPFSDPISINFFVLMPICFKMYKMMPSSSF